jgi:uncharacterized lipoprotein NlpE involved in copper resistance
MCALPLVLVVILWALGCDGRPESARKDGSLKRDIPAAESAVRSDASRCGQPCTADKPFCCDKG